MVGFEDNLKYLAVPEWKEKYLDYGRLKGPLEKIKESKLEPNTPEWDVEWNDFWCLLNSELQKVDSFFWDRFKFLRKGKQELRAKLESFLERKKKRTKKKMSILVLVSKLRTKSHSSRLRDLMAEYYRLLHMLRSFADVNQEAVAKILKKHDKVTFRKTKVDKVLGAFTSFGADKQVKELVRWTESEFISVLAGGNRKEAMNKLRVQPHTYERVDWARYRIGIMLGIVICCSAMMVGIEISRRNEPRTEEEKEIRSIYGGFFPMGVGPILLAINLHAFAERGINYPLIFDIDKRIATKRYSQGVMQSGALMLVVWALMFLSYIANIYTRTLDGSISVAITIGVFLVLFSQPWHIIVYGKFGWLFSTLARAAVAPLLPVKFADFFLADQLISMVLPLLSVESAIYLFVWGFDPEGGTPTHSGIRPLIAILPYWFRFAQCLRRYWDMGPSRTLFPHMVNAGKYFASMLVVVFSAIAVENEDHRLFPLYIGLWGTCALISMIYSLCWDLWMDWGILRSCKQPLREKLLYSRWFYFFAAVTDFILRLGWVGSLSSQLVYDLNTFQYGIVIGILEMLRRFMWNFLRLENEHLNNCGQFRVSADIDLPYDNVGLEIDVDAAISDVEDDARTDPDLTLPEPDGILPFTMGDVYSSEV
eukprot:m.78966 g.78966  ORF g.78966 m.78966 type:complete len:650 (+) comp12697_c0_seq4:469-2418(+)